jgi:ligand-binding SRPBCC domain-containing protein
VERITVRSKLLIREGWNSSYGVARNVTTKGIFNSIIHEHKFENVGNRVIMTDIFEFNSPFGILGRFFNKLVLTNYLKKLLDDRNKIIKDYAESEKWKVVLNGE